MQTKQRQNEIKMPKILQKITLKSLTLSKTPKVAKSLDILGKNDANSCHYVAVTPSLFAIIFSLERMHLG